MLSVHFASQRIYVNSIKNVSPNAQLVRFSCCEFSFKAARSGLVYNFLAPRQPIYSTFTNTGTHSTLWVFVPIVLQRYLLQLLLLVGCSLSVAHVGLVPDSQHY